MNRNRKLGMAGAALLAFTLLPTMASAQEFSDLKSNGDLHLRGYAVFSSKGIPTRSTPQPQWQEDSRAFQFLAGSP